MAKGAARKGQRVTQPLLSLLPMQMVDVGCGIGGSSRHISRKFSCNAQGITLSPVQAARANELSAAAGLGDKCKFQVTPSPAHDPQTQTRLCHRLMDLDRTSGLREQVKHRSCMADCPIFCLGVVVLISTMRRLAPSQWGPLPTSPFHASLHVALGMGTA